MKKTTAIKPSQFAIKHGVPYQTVMSWLRRGLIQGAKKREFAGIVYYEIPADAAKPEPTRGRPPIRPKKGAHRKK